MEPQDAIRRFTLAFLEEVGAEVQEQDGLFTARFPPGWKRRYGRQRTFTFDPDRRREQVELLEPGSPLLKMIVQEAKAWGGVSKVPSTGFADGTRVYTFQFEAYSSVRKRVGFVHAVLPPGSQPPEIRTGIPEFPEGSNREEREATPDLARLQEGATLVATAVENAGRRFSQEAVRESHEAFEKAMTRVEQYFEGMNQDTYLEEARIRKRLGEIQSKLYFTEDGLRELKLQKEQEKLTAELHALKKRNIQAGQGLDQDRSKQEDTQRRRHEPRLRIRLVAATQVYAPKARPAAHAPTPQPSPVEG